MCLVCRFYFVSDPTLLEILSLGSDPPAVVPHFQSGLFDSLMTVRFDDKDTNRIVGMSSTQAEQIELTTPVEAIGEILIFEMPHSHSETERRLYTTLSVILPETSNASYTLFAGNVEDWLQKLVEGMQSTMKAVIRSAVANIELADVADFINSRPAQAALLAIQFQWTMEVQARRWWWSPIDNDVDKTRWPHWRLVRRCCTQSALEVAKAQKGVMLKTLRKAETVLQEMVTATLRADLTRNQRTSLETCITIHMHQKVIIATHSLNAEADPTIAKNCNAMWLVTIDRRLWKI